MQSSFQLIEGGAIRVSGIEQGIIIVRREEACLRIIPQIYWEASNFTVSFYWNTSICIRHDTNNGPSSGYTSFIKQRAVKNKQPKTLNDDNTASKNAYPKSSHHYKSSAHQSPHSTQKAYSQHPHYNTA